MTTADLRRRIWSLLGARRLMDGHGTLPLHVHIALAMLGAILSIAANAGVIIYLTSRKE